MNNKKYQIFVSSTYVDLIETRSKVINSILALEQFPAGMEMFSAGDEQQWSIIQRTIDSSDYYIVIIGHRYGSIDPDSGISYTEKEYDYAVSKGIPVLAFIRKREVPTSPNERETDPELISRLEQFINKAKTKMCQFWDTPDDLINKIHPALFKAFHNYETVGWVRGNQAASPEMANELARLSKENSELRLELENYKKNEGIPELEVLLNNNHKLSLNYPKYVEGLVKKFQYEKINKDSIGKELLPFITDDDIENFNSKIPSVEKIKEFNKKKLEYELIKNHHILLEVSVSNFGSLKASEIYIDIEFPKEVRVFTNEYFKELEEPTLNIPKNPIFEAGRKYQESIRPFFSQMARFSNLAPRIDGFNFSHNMDHLELSSENLFLNRGENKLWVDHNNISIKMDSLLHTRRFNFSHKVYISPLFEGEFVIKCFIMCEQFKQLKRLDIPLIITKQQLEN